jgi:hypothetical protein
VVSYYVDILLFQIPYFPLQDLTVQVYCHHCICKLLYQQKHRLDAISQGPKKSPFPGPNPPPTCPRVMDAARLKSITHGAVLIIGA